MPRDNYSAAHRINRLISSSGPNLNKLVTAANARIKLEDKVRSTLPDNFQDHCKLANYQNGVLLFHAESAVWATRMRYQQKMLIERLTKIPAFAKAHNIKVVVRPTKQIPKPQIKAQSISAESCQHLEQMADSFGDSPLGKAMRNLADHRQKRQK